MSHLIREEKQVTGAEQQPAGPEKQRCTTGATQQRAWGVLAKSCQEP